MGNVPQLNTDETLRVPRHVVNEIGRSNGWLRFAASVVPAISGLLPIAYSFADQALAVGATFLANVMLARTQTKEEMECSHYPTRSSFSSPAYTIRPSSSPTPFTALEDTATTFLSICG